MQSSLLSRESVFYLSCKCEIRLCDTCSTSTWTATGQLRFGGFRVLSLRFDFSLLEAFPSQFDTSQPSLRQESLQSPGSGDSCEDSGMTDRAECSSLPPSVQEPRALRKEIRHLQVEEVKLREHKHQAAKDASPSDKK